MKKIDLIKEVFTKNNTNFNKQMVVFTKGFKAVGEYYAEHNVEGVVTLKNAKVYSYATNCECETNPKEHDIAWLNIFAKEIIGFSFI